MKKVRVGMVGLGRLGMKHAENLAFRVNGAELAAVCALEKERVEAARRDWSVPRGYADFTGMLGDRELDAKDRLPTYNLVLMLLHLPFGAKKNPQ